MQVLEMWGLCSPEAFRCRCTRFIPYGALSRHTLRNRCTRAAAAKAYSTHQGLPAASHMPIVSSWSGSDARSQLHLVYPFGQALPRTSRSPRLDSRTARREAQLRGGTGPGHLQETGPACQWAKPEVAGCDGGELGAACGARAGSEEVILENRDFPRPAGRAVPRSFFSLSACRFTSFTPTMVHERGKHPRRKQSVDQG